MAANRTHISPKLHKFQSAIVYLQHLLPSALLGIVSERAIFDAGRMFALAVFATPDEVGGPAGAGDLVVVLEVGGLVVI